MGIDRRYSFNKQPSEEFDIDIKYPRIYFNFPPSAKEIVSSQASAIKWPRRNVSDKSNATSEILFSDTPVIINPTKRIVRIRVIGGETNYDYKITVKSTFDDGTKVEREIYLRVREE